MTGFGDKDVEEVKSLFTDTGLYLLAVTVLVSMFHVSIVYSAHFHLLNHYVCTFECIFHSDFKYSNEVQRSWHFFESFVKF